MPNTSNTFAPLLAKQSFISGHLRKDIIEGRLTPGGRLPTQVQLAEQFRVSGVTIQRALDRLIREGFICTRGRNGTFVAAHPPHLYSYGVVFHDAPSVGRSRYHELLENKALRVQRVGDRRVTIFNGISGKEDGGASTELLELVRSHQLAGLLLIDGDPFVGTPLIDEAGIFRAAVMSRKVDTLPCPIVYPDMTGMVDLALDHLAANGRKRVATLCSVPVHQELGGYLRNAMRERGFVIHDRWQQIVPHSYAEAIRNCVLMLMSGSGEERPDAVFIVDDDLIEAASSGLVAAGVSAAGDVEVVSHCNFPRPEPVLPMTRIGSGCPRVLRVDSPRELPDDLAGTVGVIAGASAPEEIVQNILATLDPTGGVEEIVAVDEDEYFPLPRELREMLRRLASLAAVSATAPGADPQAGDHDVPDDRHVTASMALAGHVT